MGTKFAVMGSNLVEGYKEITLYALLPQIYPQDFVGFLLRNYFRFLEDIFHKWLENFYTFLQIFTFFQLGVLMKILNYLGKTKQNFEFS